MDSLTTATTANSETHAPSERGIFEVVCYIVVIVICLGVTLFVGLMAWRDLSEARYVAGSLWGLFFLIAVIKLVEAVEDRPGAKKTDPLTPTRGRGIWTAFAAIVFILGALVCLAGLILKIFWGLGGGH